MKCDGAVRGFGTVFISVSALTLVVLASCLCFLWLPPLEPEGLRLSSKSSASPILPPESGSHDRKTIPSRFSPRVCRGHPPRRRDSRERVVHSHRQDNRQRAPHGRPPVPTGDQVVAEDRR